MENFPFGEVSSTIHSSCPLPESVATPAHQPLPVSDEHLLWSVHSPRHMELILARTAMTLPVRDAEFQRRLPSAD